MSPITATAPRTDPRPARSTRTRPGPDRSPWTCPNCRRETLPPRKRCTDCGTSRY